ncbi:MAG: outer membrane protein transport protein [Mariprofundaceae bacterium]|nr:outer membrane protein transport protein [Mariprofundaceae bacterium]
MKLFNRYAMSVAGLLCLFPVITHAGGYMIPEQGAKAVGMGNAFTAVADDPSANWFNPAGLSFQKNGVMIGGDVVAPSNEYIDPVGNKTYSAKKSIFLVPHTYINYRADDSKLSFGFGINAPFGLSTDWAGSGAPFSQAGAGSKSITFSQIEAIHVNPNIAYRVSENLSLAAGIAYYNVMKVHLNSLALNIGGHGDGFGGNAALMYKNDGYSLGVSYRSSVKVDINGTAVGGSGVAVLGLNGIAGNATTSLEIPSILSVAGSYQWQDWLVSLQFDRVDWTSFNKIELNFAPSALNLATGTSQTIPENWRTTTTIRLGAEWRLDSSNAIRFGYVNDPTPTNSVDVSPRIPGNDRQLLTLGYGLKMADDITVDLAYAYVWLKDRNLTTASAPVYNGTYKSFVHLFSSSFIYRF